MSTVQVSVSRFGLALLDMNELVCSLACEFQTSAVRINEKSQYIQKNKREREKRETATYFWRWRAAVMTDERVALGNFKGNG